MKKYKQKILSYFVIFLTFFSTAVCGYCLGDTALKKTNGCYSCTLHDDALIPPDVPAMNSVKRTGPGPGFYDTSEYMIGDVSVGLIFLESNGELDPNTENWTSSEESGVVSQVQQALRWWTTQNPDAKVNFIVKTHYKVQIRYEPIIHPSAITNNQYEKLWVTDAMTQLGYETGDWMEKTRTYINDLRNDNGIDWAFIIFIVDSSGDSDGSFSDSFNSYAYKGGPFVVLTYDNDGWGISRMNQVAAHEIGHIFYATDEYNGETERSGYLNAMDSEGSGGLMDTAKLSLSSGTKLQVGWRDVDSDGILDIVDTLPETNLNMHVPDPTSDVTPTYTGNATVIPYPNDNPLGPGNDVTIAFISSIEYRVDGGTWNIATAVDGGYDDPCENFTFTLNALSLGEHYVEAYAISSVGNRDQDPSFDTLIIIENDPPTKPSKPSGSASGRIGRAYTYTSDTIDPNGDMVSYFFDWGDGNDSGWVGPIESGVTTTASHIWGEKGGYEIKVKAKDEYGAESEWSDPLPVTMPKTYDNPFQHFIEKLLEWFFSNIFKVNI